MKRFETIRISETVLGVGFKDETNEGTYTNMICQTLYDTGDEEQDEINAEIWADNISLALNKFFQIP